MIKIPIATHTVLVIAWYHIMIFFIEVPKVVTSQANAKIGMHEEDLIPIIE